MRKWEPFEWGFPISNQQQQDPNRFEPLTPGSEVLLTVRNMCHTYMPPRFQMCERKKPPVEVLKGLDVDICRGEVFGLLGHNGKYDSAVMILFHVGDVDL